MENTTYQVQGMTCNHCKHAVETALQALDGVAMATVNLDKGEVQISFSEPIALEDIRAAVDEAGYELVS